MRQAINEIPAHHSGIRGYFQGVSHKGLNFDIEVETTNTGLSTNGRARRMMELRERVQKQAASQGRALGVYNPIRNEAADEETTITLRIAAPDRVRRINIMLNLDGSYSSGSSHCSTLRDVVREVCTQVEVVNGMGGVLPSAGRRPDAGHLRF